MSFKEYLEEKLPGYADKIGPELYKQLEDLYNESKDYKALADKNLSDQFKNPGIDYSTDFEKNNQRSYEYIEELKRQLVQVKNEIDKENRNNMKM